MTDSYDENSYDLAAEHVVAISDSGDGYTISHGWHVKCLWCGFETTSRLKSDAVAAYRRHEQEMFDIHKT